jgi:hypothetical protein
MNKVGIIAITLLVAGIVNARAQETDRILFNVPITLTGKLSDKTAVTGASLDQGSLSFGQAQRIVVGSPTDTVYSIGNSLGLTNEVSGSITNIRFSGTLIWSSRGDVVVSKPGAKATTITMVLAEPAGGILDLATSTSVSNAYATISNSVLFADVTLSASGNATNIDTVSGKFTGIWFDGSTTVSGTIKTEKLPR